MTDNLYLSLRQITFCLIDADKAVGNEVKFENINSYIDRATMSLKITCDEETFFYHSDHLGSTTYITDKDANIAQFDAYLPYGELLVDDIPHQKICRISLMERN